MLAPDFKRLIVNDLTGPIRTYILEHHDAALWEKLCPFVKSFQDIRKELPQAGSFQNDIAAVQQFQVLFAKSYCYSMSLNQYFPFGPHPY